MPRGGQRPIARFLPGETVVTESEQDSVPVPGGDSPVPVPSDRSLLRRLRGGSQDAATQLYVRYAHRVRALVKRRCSAELARRVEPDDIVQSVFRRFFGRVVKGDYDVPAGEELWGLFLVIALNRIRAAEAFHRAGKRDVRATVSAAEAGQYLEGARGHDEAAFALLQLTITDAMGQLPEHHRQMLELRIQGHEVAEIAQMTGRSKRTVERNLQEVRASLRSFLDRETIADESEPDS